MTYEQLLEKYKTKEVFIYGRSVMQIVDMSTQCRNRTLETDFTYRTDRHHRGVITVAHPGRSC